MINKETEFVKYIIIMVNNKLIIKRRCNFEIKHNNNENNFITIIINNCIKLIKEYNFSKII